jgi:hypothetical protein
MSRKFLSCLTCTFVILASSIGAPRAHAGEFDVVPLSNPLYKHLTHVQSKGWTGAPQKAQPDAATQELTRYEIALETAKAIFTVNARNRTDSAWAATASRPTLRSLRELTLAMRDELKKLDIDAPAAVQFIDSLLKATPVEAPLLHAPIQPRSVLANGAAGTPRKTQSTGTTGSWLEPATQTAIEFPMSQSLRVHTVISSLAREAQDPLAKSRVSLSQTDAELDVTSWLSVRGVQQRQRGGQGISSFQSRLANEADLLGSPEATITGGGLGISLRPGFTFSGNLARVRPASGAGTPATRLEGGVGLSGWQNRLVLSANVYRLMQAGNPDDSDALSTTAANLNLDVGLTERLRLNLLYQQLFGAQPQRQADRVVAGGITINF